jgi:hypothetical protein
MPVVVMKATEGFADRLQSLSHCIEYCKTHDAYLCVDWSDIIWGNGEFNFQDVFELRGLKTMTKEQVCILARQPGIKINPPAWTPELIWMPSNRSIFKEELVGDFMTKSNPIPKCEGDILVTNGNGDRGWWTRNIAEHVVLRPHVSEQVRALLTGFNPNSCVVHLRGTDRPDETFTDHAITTISQFPEECPVYVVTDMPSMWYKFKTGVPRSELVNKGDLFKLPETSKYGTHHILPTQIKEYGVNKWTLMIELLADFVALWSAQWAVGKTQSHYFRMAREMAKLPSSGLSRFLGGWTPWEKVVVINNETFLLSNRVKEETSEAVGAFVPCPRNLC